MRHLKFITLLRTLGKDEVDSFWKYLKKEHANERIALSLFAYIKKFHPEYRDEKRLEMAYAYRKVFRAEIGKNRKQVLNALSDLYGWLKSFLLSEKATKGVFESQLLWLAFLQEKGLQVEFPRYASRFQRELKSVSKKNALDYLKEVAVNHFIQFHLALGNFPPEGNDGADLDLFYALAKLKSACEKANFINVQSLETEPEPLPEHLEVFLRQIQHEEPLLLLYMEVYQLLVVHHNASFDKLETMLPKFVDEIAPAELNLILRYLHNYATSQIRKGKVEFWKRTHQLNKFSLEHRIFAHEGTMSGAQFNNIVSAACSAKEISWAQSFVKAQSKLLSKDLRDDAVLLANATILFEKNEFKKVLEILREENFRDIFDNVRSRALQMRSYYEIWVKEKTAAIWDFHLNFESYLRRHRTPKKEAIEATLKFIQILKMLFSQKASRDDIQQVIQTTDVLYFKTWLLDKLADYKAEFAAPKRKK